MKARFVTETHILIESSKDDARELRSQMLAFWKTLAVAQQHPHGDSPFARLYAELDRVLKEV